MIDIRNGTNLSVLTIHFLPKVHTLPVKMFDKQKCHKINRSLRVVFYTGCRGRGTQVWCLQCLSTAPLLEISLKTLSWTAVWPRKTWQQHLRSRLDQFVLKHWNCWKMTKAVYCKYWSPQYNANIDCPQQALHVYDPNSKKQQQIWPVYTL